MQEYCDNEVIVIVIYISLENNCSDNRSMNINIMEQKPLTNAQIEKATSRRSRKDEEGRDFLCGCGKRYLSYPALYTHIKTKHQGKQPQGTLKTGATGTITKRTKAKLQDDTLRTILSLASKEDFRLLNQLEEGHLGSVAVGSRIKKENVPKEIYDVVLGLMKHQECKLNQNSSLQLALAVYLLNAGEYVNDKVYDYYLLFARLARNCYFTHGKQIYRACFTKKDGGVGYLPHFAQGQVRHFPIVSAFMDSHYVPEAEFVKDKQITLPIIQLILSDFCGWLERRHFSGIKVSFKKQYKLDVKPSVVLLKPKLTPKKDDSKDKQIEEQHSNSQEVKKDDDSESVSEGEEIYQQDVPDQASPK